MKQNSMRNWLGRCAIFGWALLSGFFLFVSSPQAAPVPSRVFVQCVVMQGNGYNWASTLGWLSGQVEIAAARASAWEAAHPGSRAGIDLRCATGSSSGGPAAAVLDALLENPTLVDRNDDWLTPEEAQGVSRALMFLALSTNFDGEYRRLVGTGIGAWLGLFDRSSNALGGRYWRGVSTASVNAAIFGDWVRAARVYDPAWHDALMDEAGPLPLYAERPAQLGQSGEDPAAARMEALANAARGQVDKALQQAPATDVPVGPGICATALAVTGRPKPPFSYADLRLIAICDPETFTTLSSNTHLGEWLGSSTQMQERLVLASTRSWRNILNITLREPELMTPLTGKLRVAPIGLDAIAVPAGADSSVAAGPLVMMGGFADPRLQAWISAAMLSGKLDALERRGVEGDGRLAVFGRTEDRDDPTETFAQRTIVKYFDSLEMPFHEEGTLPFYYDWQDEVCPVAEDLARRSHVDFYRMDWNLPGGAGAIAGHGQTLAAKGYNLGKIQTPRDKYPELPSRIWRTFAFDPIDTQAYLPTPPPGGMPCLPLSSGGQD
ncbi:hypothetical protein [Amaricoccus macauensis]|uniref:hypothetical protein n=1 Tax=Amaricoccus macauensis TaxID=57001 RepID=UPI003C7B67C7